MYLPEKLRETLSIFGERGTIRIGGVALNKILDWKFADRLDDEEQVKQLVNYEDPKVFTAMATLLCTLTSSMQCLRTKNPTSILKMGKRQWKSCLAFINPANLELQWSFL